MKDEGIAVNRKRSYKKEKCLNCKYGGISSEIQPPPYTCNKGIWTDPDFICDLYEAEKQEELEQ